MRRSCPLPPLRRYAARYVSRYAAATLVLLAACAGRSHAGSEERNPRLITREQVLASHYQTAYQVVQALRPNWLRTRGTDSFYNPGQVQVYLDDQLYGGVESLRSLDANAVHEIRFFDATEATQRWGIGHTQGVIDVISQAGP